MARAGGGGGRPLPAESRGDLALPGPRGGRAAGGGALAARLMPGRQTPRLLKLRGGRPRTARGGCVRRRTQLQVPARPPRARPAEQAGVCASKGPATRDTRAPCTAPTPLSPRYPRPPSPTTLCAPAHSLGAPHSAAPSATLAGIPPRAARIPHYTPRSPATEELAVPPARRALPTLAPALRATGCARESPAEFSGRALGSAAAPGPGRGRQRAEPLSQAGPARIPGPSPAAGAPGRSRARWAPSWRQVAQRRRRGTGGGGGARGAGAAGPRETLRRARGSRSPAPASQRRGGLTGRGPGRPETAQGGARALFPRGRPGGLSKRPEPSPGMAQAAAPSAPAPPRS